MAFDPANYDGQILIASGDFRAELHDGVRQIGPSPLPPAAVSQASGAFLDAGARVLITPTDSFNSIRLADVELDVERMNREAAEAVCGAASDHPVNDVVTLGALGPVSALLMLDEIDEETLSQSYRNQAGVLLAAGVDAIVCRSFVELAALRIAVGAAVSAGALVVASLAIDAGSKFEETALLSSAPEACQVLADAGVAMVGCDGSAFPDETAGVISLLKEACKLPVYAEVNAGQPELVEQQAAYTETPGEFGERLAPLADAGAMVIGGGRGTTAKHVAALHSALDVYLRRRAKHGGKN